MVHVFDGEGPGAGGPVAGGLDGVVTEGEGREARLGGEAEEGEGGHGGEVEAAWGAGRAVVVVGREVAVAVGVGAGGGDVGGVEHVGVDEVELGVRVRSRKA